jgi:2-methylcitrate dehydratase PrpD
MTIDSPRRGSLTAYVADFIAALRYERLPDDVLELGKKSILDGLGLAFSGSAAKSGRLLRHHLGELGCTTAECAVIGTSMRVPARFAAFANGTAIHADDYDDTQLAVAEREGRSGRDLLTAYHPGVEVECKVAEAIDPRHCQHGFHSTATCGTFGAAAGVSHLLGLPGETVRRALAIAGSQSAGLRENFGTCSTRSAPWSLARGWSPAGSRSLTSRGRAARPRRWWSAVR